MKDNQEIAFNKIYGICAHHVKGGSTIIFRDLLSSFDIKKQFINEKLKDIENSGNETDYISFQSLSKSPLTWFKFLINYFKTSFSIYKETHAYSVVLANELISTLYILPHKAFRKLHIIYYCHSAFRDTIFNKLFLSRIINCISEVIVVPSLYLKNDLIKMGIKDSKIQCIYNGIVEFKLPIHLKNEDSDCRLKVCIIGIIQYQKGQDIFIEAISNLNRDGYNITGNIVGPVGEYSFYEDLKNRCVNTQLGQTIKFLGTLNHQSTIEFMNTQDIVICLSRHRETLPTVLLEAMSLRKAVIATRIGGIPEIIADGENGYLIDPDNTDQLQDAILKLMEQEHRLSLGEFGYNVFLNKFNREIFLKQHKLLIQNYLQKQFEK